MLKKILDTARTTKGFRQLTDRLRTGSSLTIRGVHGSLDTVLIRLLSEERSQTVVIAADNERFAKIRDDLDELTDRSSVFVFPDDELLPYDSREPNVNLVSLRQEALERLSQNGPGLFVTSARALCKRIPPPDRLTSDMRVIRTGSKTEFEPFVEYLPEVGLDRQDIVDRVGTFAVRGGIVDVYPFAREVPVRLEFFGDEIESLREFDIITQRSTGAIDEVTIFPKSTVAPGEAVAGRFLDYVAPEALVVLMEPELITARAQSFYEEAETYFRRNIDEGQQVPGVDELFVDPETVKGDLYRNQTIQFAALSGSGPGDIRFDTKSIENFGGRINVFLKVLRESSRKETVSILCSNQAQADRLEEIMVETNVGLEIEKQIMPGVDFHIGVGELHGGFRLVDAALTVYTDHEIFGRVKRVRPHRRFRTGEALRHLNALKFGDYVVHVDHGIGKFAGLTKVRATGHVQECLKILYDGDDKVFVPLEYFNRVQKYTAEEGVAPKINKLGSREWERVKARTKKTVKMLAFDLIKLYAERKSRSGFAFSPDNYLQHELDASFEFEETPDQAAAIDDVKQDMEKDRAMDRLVCGDVGYGKTEVAVRAAFKATLDGKQAAVLVPTTILAQQHFETFSDRYREFPVRVDFLSRFKTAQQQKKTIERLASGEIDVLIGTHRLLSKDVKFKRLGLLVVDEEQRFGVAHKEKLKRFRADIDILTLTATPIPRTLQFSLLGVRDLSNIYTPPKNRLPIITEITEFNETIIHDAITREIDRGGQVYFVHNRIDSIENVLIMLERIVPRARYVIAHGQMKEQELDEKIHGFMNRKFDVLICTNIIENGIDITNVNTIIIDRADRGGVSQLYQLRGRVGRSERQAYAYFLTPPYSRLSEGALKRLAAIEEFSDLGSGFQLAMRDLEIRGAGNLLGAEQTGFINAMGYELYSQILNEAVEELKQEQFAELTELKKTLQPAVDVKVDTDADAYIPDSYLDVPAERINIYKKISAVADRETLDELGKELEDRFGKVPVEVQNLLLSIQIKLEAARYGLGKIRIRNNKMTAAFGRALIEDSERGEEFQIRLNRLVEQIDTRFRFMQDKERNSFEVVMDLRSTGNESQIFEVLRFLEKLNEETLVQA